MRSFYVRRKDLDHVPFQYYVKTDGTALPLESGYTAVFVVVPPKDDIGEFYVRILDGFIQEMHERWAVGRDALLRIAAKAVESWLTNEPIPGDHFYGPEWLKVDSNWYPRDRDGSPAMVANPYEFQAISDEPWPSIDDWEFLRQPAVEPQAPVQMQVLRSEKIVFGFTLDVFPAMVIVGYEQMKHKVAEAGLNVQVQMLPLGDLPPQVNTLFVPAELADAARQAAPGARVIASPDMINLPAYDTLVRELSHLGSGAA